MPPCLAKKRRDEDGATSTFFIYSVVIARDLRACDYSYVHGLQVGGEVAEEWGFVGEVHAGDSFAMLPDFQDDFDDIVDVTLSVDAARDRGAD